jgi:hypothetical protein
MSELTCTCCGKPLTGSIDTYGDVGAELCIYCFLTPDFSGDIDLLKAELKDARSRLNEIVQEWNNAYFYGDSDIETEALLPHLEDEMQAVQDDIGRIEEELAELYRRRAHPAPSTTIEEKAS